MEAFVILLLIVVLILLLVRTGSLSTQLEKMERQLLDIRRAIAAAGNASKTAEQATEPVAKPEPEVALPPIITPAQRWAPKPPEPEKPIEEEVYEPLQEAPRVTPAPEPVVVMPPPVRTPPPPPVPPKPGFFERNPDLEKFIGENLISKIGIAILVIGIGFFVKYAIDNNWIGEIGRVCIGLLCGGLLVGLAHRLQKNYAAFSSVLIGGGLAIFYFTIGLAYHQYHLFGQAAAFSFMVLITVFAILLSLLYNRQEVAIIALTGGFAVPFMVSNGSGNYVALFTYLLVLNAGILIIAYRKGWRLLNGLAFGYTVILFGSWLFTLNCPVAAAVWRNGFLFATAFYLLYLAINLAHNIREQRRFIASDFGILLANTALYFSAGLYLFYLGGVTSNKGVFAAAMGLLNLGLCYYLYRNKKVDKNIFYLLTGITLTFVSITAPLQLQGHFITLFWASEAVVLWWLLQQSGIKILRVAFLVVWVASLASLVIDWGRIYGLNTAVLPVLLNRIFITSLVVIAANGLLYRLMRRSGDRAKSGWLPPAPLFGIAALALGLLAGLLEINYQFSTRAPGADLAGLYLPLYAMGYGLALRLYFGRRAVQSRVMPPLLSGICLLIYLLALGLHVLFQRQAIVRHQYGAHFLVHWLVAALAVVCVYQLTAFFRRLEDAGLRSVGAWALSGISVLLVSVEMYLLINALMANDAASMDRIGRNYVRVGLPIVWGMCSFALMYLGFRHKARMLRIIALTLFGITLVKLFAFDISDLAPGGKIAAFCCLGVLLLVVSFMYQRLKRIIANDESTRDAE